MTSLPAHVEVREDRCGAVQAKSAALRFCWLMDEVAVLPREKVAAIVVAAYQLGTITDITAPSETDRIVSELANAISEVDSLLNAKFGYGID